MEDEMVNPPGEERGYSPAWQSRGRNDVILMEVIKFERRSLVEVELLRNKSDRRRGVYLHFSPPVRLVGGEVNRRHEIWSESMKTTCVFEVTSVPSVMWVYHLYEVNGRRQSQAHTSGMVLRVGFDGARHYSCHDFGWDETFDDLEFLVRIRTDV